MKTSQTFLYDESTGNIQYINKKQFISNIITKLSKDQKKVFSLDEVKKINNFTYKDIIQEFDTSFKKLEKGIYSLKLNQSKIILICLLDKTTTDFEKFCKKNKLKFGQEVEKLDNIEKNPQNQGIIYNKDKSINNILKYKPKESKEELKMKNKNLIKKVAVASLAVLISVPNIANAYNVTEQMKGTGIGPVLSATNQGKYTQIEDDWGNTHLVNSNQWQEYQLLLQQGSPKVKNVWVGWNEDSFYAIAAYQLEGQQKVELPKDKYIKVSDPYNCDQLSVLKYLGNTLGSQYLFNEEKAYNDMVKQAQKNNARAAAEATKQQAENQRSAEESARNAQINAEMDIWDTKGKFKHNSQLPYTLDYLRNYKTNIKKSQEKIWASFDNERNYVQQWLNKNNLTLKQLRDMNYTTVNLEENSKKYGKQMYQANVYFEWIENGILPKNCSTGDWIRFMIERNAMSGWNWLALWSDKVDFTPIADGTLQSWGTFEDISNINIEIYEMIKKDYSVILNYKTMSKEGCINQIESLCGGFITPIATTTLAKSIYPQYQSRTELSKKLIDEFNALYSENK